MYTEPKSNTVGYPSNTGAAQIEMSKTLCHGAMRLCDVVAEIEARIENLQSALAGLPEPPTAPCNELPCGILDRLYMSVERLSRVNDELQQLRAQII